MIYKVTVGVPIYNVEKYIERCLKSLFEQTLEDIEFIFVNDSSPDHSIDILNDILNLYPNRKKDTKIINHERNLGSATARNTILNNASGEYIIFCDADDWVDINMYKTLYNIAKEKKADIVWSYLCFVENKYRYEKFIPYKTKEDAIKSLLLVKESGQVLTRLIKRDLYMQNNINFPDGYNMMEDLTVMIRLIYFSNKIVYLKDKYLYYLNRKTSVNQTSINNLSSAKWQKDAYHNIELISNFLSSKSTEYNKVIKEVKLLYKIKFIAFNPSRNDLHNIIWPDIKANPFGVNSWSFTTKVYMFLRMKKIFPQRIWNKIKYIMNK